MLIEIQSLLNASGRLQQRSFKPFNINLNVCSGKISNQNKSGSHDFLIFAPHH